MKNGKDDSVFNIDIKKFKKSTMKRILKEVFFAVTLVAIFLGDIFFISTSVVDIVVLSVFVLYFFYQYIDYPRTIREMINSKLYLSDDSLTFDLGKNSSTLFYNEIQYLKVEEPNKGLNTIILKLSSGEELKLKNFENVEGLYNKLVSKIPQNN